MDRELIEIGRGPYPDDWLIVYHHGDWGDGYEVFPDIESITCHLGSTGTVVGTVREARRSMRAMLREKIEHGGGKHLRRIGR